MPENINVIASNPDGKSERKSETLAWVYYLKSAASIHVYWVYVERFDHGQGVCSVLNHESSPL